MPAQSDKTAYRALSTILVLIVFPITLMMPWIAFTIAMYDGHWSDFDAASEPLWISLIAAGAIYCPAILYLGWKKQGPATRRLFKIINLTYFSLWALCLYLLLILSLLPETG